METTLKDKNSSAVILSKGAELRSLKLSDGREIMWRADPAYWGKSSPILFPMIGNLRGSKTIINGREYEITKHGFARDNEFEAEQPAENRALFTFRADEETKKHFPFDFVLTLEYILENDSLTMNYRVRNDSSSDMPFCIGAHPAFACPFGSESFSDCKLVFEKAETVNSPIMDLETRMWGDGNRIKRLENEREFSLGYSLFDNDCVYFDSIASKSVILASPKAGKGVKLSWSGFETLGVWTPDHKEAPFVCIEPWCGCDDYDTDSGVFCEKRGIQTAKPSQTKEYSMKIESVVL